MSLYSVYARGAAAPTVVGDGFSWLAFLLPPVWALAHRLWLFLIVWIAATIIIGAIGTVLGHQVGSGLYFLMSLLVGFEAGAVRRAKLRRAGWGFRTDLVAQSEDLALRDYLLGR